MAQRSQQRVRRRREIETPSVAETPAFRLGRVLLGGILAFMALDNFRNLDQRVEYAESRGAPIPNVSVPTISSMLLVGGLGIALWRYPRVAAGAAASFFVSVTPVMHDFWNLEDPQEKQQQMIHFLKNTALLGAILLVIGLGRRTKG